MIIHFKREVAAKAAEQIGEQVRSERKRLGLAQDELALAAGVSTRVIHQIEARKPTSRLDSIAAVLDALGLELRVEAEQGPVVQRKP
jgi:HTH-type transcriptional regulator / antitoxin HipB